MPMTEVLGGQQPLLACSRGLMENARHMGPGHQGAAYRRGP